MATELFVAVDTLSTDLFMGLWSNLECFADQCYQSSVTSLDICVRIA